MMEIRQKTPVRRVVVFDRCPLFREALCRVINATDGFMVVFDTGKASEVMERLESSRIDVVILDLDAGEETLDILQNVKDSGMPIRVVVTIMNGMQAELMAAIRMQADGFLSKYHTASEFSEQMKKVGKGAMVISNALTNALAVTLRSAPGPEEQTHDVNTLSPREFEVFRCIANGMSNRVISESLAISDGTVKVHVKHVLKKLNFASRVEAALWASQNAQVFAMGRRG